MKKKHTYIDLFSGCGGLSLGLYNSGNWKGKFAIEKSIDAFKTLEFNLIDRNNHFDWPVWLPQKNHDINIVLNKYSKELINLRGEVDMVTGGPPCQGFSTAGRRKEGDIRNQLVESYIKFIRLVQPKIIFFENVKGFIQKFEKNKIKGKVYSNYVQNALKRNSKKFDSYGYNLCTKLINFSEYGIPQKRTRFILIGIRKDYQKKIKPEFFFDNIKNDSTDFLKSKGLDQKVSLEDAISDLLSLNVTESPDSKLFKAGLYNLPKSNYQKFIRCRVTKSLPDSHRLTNHSPETIEKFRIILELSDRNKTLSNELKKKFNIKKRTIIPLCAKLPTPTITTLPDDYVHYSEPRIFTVREYARIQTFNDWYEFKGKYTTGGKRRSYEVPRYSQIGNAIPPIFGQQAGLTIYKMLNNE